MQSNRPENIILFLDRLEETISDTSSIEVIVKIDEGDAVMERLLPEEQETRSFAFKFIQTPLPDGFYGLWRSMNEMLDICDPNAYFLLNLNDEMYFRTKVWDEILRSYVWLFPDNIFRLRTSNQGYRNYFDFWECGFAPETSAFTTRRWIEIGGDWTPCTGPDSFQQFVAFYLQYFDRFDQVRPMRDIPIAEIDVGGEGGNVGIVGDELRERMRQAINPWFRLVSYPIQQEASRRARKLSAHIWAHENGIDKFELRDRKLKKRIDVVDPDTGQIHRSFYYRLSRILLVSKNLVRILNYGYYGGAGNAIGRMPCEFF